jgi:hypothetical protein
MVEEPGTYQIALTPWVIINFISAKQQTVIRRFRNQNDAVNNYQMLI